MTIENRTIAQLWEARAEISELHRAINALESEVTAQRSRAKKAELEAERLRAAMPSVSAVRWVRCWYDNAVHALASVGHLMDDRRDVNEQLSELSEWLQRVEAAKNGGDHG